MATADPLVGHPLGPDTLAAALARLGHHPVLVAPAGDPDLPGTPPVPVVRGPVVRAPLRPIFGRAGLEVALTALASREVLRRRPQVALVFAQDAGFGVARALAALGLPVVLLYPERRLPAPTSPLRQALNREALRLAARCARALVTLDPSVPARLEAEVGIRGISVLGGGSLDLDGLPLEAPEAARTQIGLLSTQRFTALTGPLEPSVRVDLLALAHRRVAGVGLLVVGTGAQDSLVAAMSASTRPSSPILHVPTLDAEARSVALRAADLALSLDAAGIGEDILWAAALGRRVVALDAPGLDRIEQLYPGLEPVIRVRQGTAEALREGIEAGLAIERARGPLPRPAVDAARRSLGRGRPVDQLVEVLASVALP